MLQVDKVDLSLFEMVFLDGTRHGSSAYRSCACCPSLCSQPSFRVKTVAGSLGHVASLKTTMFLLLFDALTFLFQGGRAPEIAVSVAPNTHIQEIYFPRDPEESF